MSKVSYADKYINTEADLKASITLPKLLLAQVPLYYFYYKPCSSVPTSCGGATVSAIAFVAYKSDHFTSAGKAALIGLGALSIYNLTVDENKNSEDTILVNNIMAFNLTLGISYLLLNDDNYNTSLSFLPLSHDGLQLAFNYKF